MRDGLVPVPGTGTFREEQRLRGGASQLRTRAWHRRASTDLEPPSFLRN